MGEVCGLFEAEIDARDIESTLFSTCKVCAGSDLQQHTLVLKANERPLLIERAAGRCNLHVPGAEETGLIYLCPPFLLNRFRPWGAPLDSIYYSASSQALM